MAVAIAAVVPVAAVVSFVRSLDVAATPSWFAISIAVLAGLVLIANWLMAGSAAPFIGTLLAAAAVGFGWGVGWIAIASFVFALLDRGGLVLLLWSLWKDRSFWDA